MYTLMCLKYFYVVLLFYSNFIPQILHNHQILKYRALLNNVIDHQYRNIITEESSRFGFKVNRHSSVAVTPGKNPRVRTG